MYLRISKLDPRRHDIQADSNDSRKTAVYRMTVHKMLARRYDMETIWSRGHRCMWLAHQLRTVDAAASLQQSKQNLDH